jgi:CBS domain-containing protein
MVIRKIMTTNVECIAPETTIQDAASKMKSLDVGFLPICENDRLLGAITDRDIVLRALADGKDCNTIARDVMSDKVFFCFDDESIDDCANHMKEHEVKRMLVLNREKRLVGVVSIGDLSKIKEKAAGQTLKDISDAA